MTAQIIDGREIAQKLKADVARDVKQLGVDGIGCALATVIVGEDYRARAYERRLQRIARELDVLYRPMGMLASSSGDEVLATVRRLNDDPEVSGVLVLRPLPPHISEVEVFQALSPIKDIEAVHPENAGLLALGTPRYVPSTAASVFHVLDTWLDEEGEDRSAFYHRSLIVVVGRSNNVGKPAISLAYDRQAAVESVDEWVSRNGQLGWHTRRADVLIVAAGVAGLIRSEHIHEGAVVLDVGINPVRDERTGAVHLVGDVAFEQVAERARAITPVPGGIGPVTDVWLLRNTVSAARNAAAARWIAHTLDYVLTLSCADRPGIVYTVSKFLVNHDCNIVQSQQFDDRGVGMFFMRVQFEPTGGVELGVAELRHDFAAVAAPFAMSWRLLVAAEKQRVLIMVSKFGHCLNDLLFRSSTGGLNIEVPAVVSNHPDLGILADNYSIPFFHLPVTTETKSGAEARLLELVGELEIDLVVLARYMQILSTDLCQRLQGRAINIHHSILPSFKGARPYYQAHDRGVKLVGATAHYVTADLDEGPIIEQEVARVDHSMTAEEVAALGRDTECQALARAVRWHTENRVLLNGRRTVVLH